MDSVGTEEWAAQAIDAAFSRDMAGAHAVLDDAFLATYMLDAQCTRAEAYLRLKNEGSRQVCQYQFRKNDIVWICKQCQRDETCVLCNDCFPFSAHDGHEVFFYHSQAGGCCDCGDPGAWDPAGFCHRHGKVHESPVKDLPQGLLTTGRSVISSMSAYLENYSVSHAALFDIDHFLATPQPEIDPDTKLPLLYSLAVKSGDVHTPDEIDALLAVAMLPITPSQRGRMVLELMRDGSVVVATAQYSVISEYLGRLQSLADGPKLVVSVDKVNSKDERKGQFLINCISWLIKLAGISDGICAFICSTLPVERLRRIMVADCYLPEAVIKPFHELLLMLMADISFKRVIAGAYALALPETTQKYGDGVGMSELSVFRISVQFLNRYVFVSEIVHKYSFLENLASGLLRMMRSSSSTHHDSIFDRSMYTLKHHVIKHRRYDAILGDLKIIFILPTIPKIFCMNCLDTLLDAVETMQYIDPQSRQLAWHVEYENDTWVAAFNIHLSFASLFDGLIGWFGGDDDALRNLPESERPHVFADTDGRLAAYEASNVLLAILRALISWHQKRFNIEGESVLPTIASRDVCPVFNRPPQDFSFHILFHRFLSSCIKECCRFPQHFNTLSNFATFLSSCPSSAFLSSPISAVTSTDPNGNGLWWFYSLVDFPVLSLVTASQIKLKMWARNGVCMLDQLLNYQDFPFSRIFRDLDALLIQFCGTVLGSRLFLQHLYNRFNVHSLLANKRFDLSHNDPPKSRQLLDEMFHNIIILLTELPLPPSLEPPKTRGCSMDIDCDIHINTKPSGDDECDNASRDESRCRAILRREVLHRLMAGACSYSQLYETRVFLPGQNKSFDDIVDSIVAEIGVVKKSGGIEETIKIYLKPEFWTEYDPCFYHVTLSQHQNILESKPRVKEPTAICPAPPEAHPNFIKFRNDVLMDPMLLGYVRDLLYSFVALRFEKEIDKKQDITSLGQIATAAHSEAIMEGSDEFNDVFKEQRSARKKVYLSVLAVTKPWVLQCTDTTYLKCCQILTLLIHHLEYLLSKPTNVDSYSEIEKLSAYLRYSPHTHVSPPLSAFLDSTSEDPNISVLSISQLIQHQLSALSSPGMSGANTGYNSIYASAVNSNTNSASNSRRPSIDGMESIMSGASTIFDYGQPPNVTGINISFAPMHGSQLTGIVVDKYMSGIVSADSINSEVALQLPSLLGVMLMAHDMLQSDDDAESKNFMRWCLDKLRALLPVCDKIIVNWMKAQLDNERDVYMKAKRIEAREKITREMSLLTENFLKSAEYTKMVKGSVTRSKNDTSAEMYSGLNDKQEDRLSGTKRADGGELPVEDDECIICRGNNEKAGTMAYLVHTQAIKDRRYNGALNSDCEPGLDGICSVSELCGSHVHFRFCGHAMHMSCFDAFYPQVVLRSIAQQHLLIDTDIGEFQCPLCKMLNNAVVPITNNAEDRISVNVDPNRLLDTNMHKVAKLDVTSDLEGIETPVRIISDLVTWMSNPARQGLLVDYVYPSSFTLPVDVVVPFRPPHDITDQSSRRPHTDSWISRAMSSFPLKFFDTYKSESDRLESDLFDEFTARAGQSRIPFVLPRPDDLVNVLDASVQSRQQSCLQFLASIASTHTKVTAGQMKDQRVLDAISVTVHGVAATIAIEAMENFPGSHLINRSTVGMDQLKAIRSIVDMLGKCLINFHISKGIHQSLLSAIVGDTVNILWMADNSIPVTDRYSSAAAYCVESANVFSKAESTSSEPLVLTIRRAIQLYATCLSDHLDDNTFSSSNIFLMPLLARPLLDTLLLAVALHRTCQSAVPIAKCIDFCSSDELAEALAARYLDQSTDVRSDEMKAEPTLSSNSTLAVLCKWIILARLSQLVVLFFGPAKQRQAFAGTEFPDKNYVVDELPLEPLVRSLYANTGHYLSCDNGEDTISSFEVKQILLDWLVFIRSAIHVLLRCHYDVRNDGSHHTGSYIHVFNYSESGLPNANFLLPLQHELPEDPMLLTSSMIMSHLAAVDLLEMLEVHNMEEELGDARLESSLLAMNEKWLKALTHPQELSIGASTVSSLDSCNLASDILAHINDGTLCDALTRSVSHPTQHLRNSFVTTGFAGFMLPLWKLFPFTEWTSDSNARKNNVNALSDRLVLLKDTPGAANSPLLNLPRRKIYAFPESYTKFHQQIRSICDYEYPAVCLTCGQILNSGGKAQCTRHVRECSGDAGAFFLLQDCQVLFCYYSRASYFPAPFIDDHGEKHRQFRGKPLHLDKKRYENLRLLIATGGIANEVVQKRSTSQRVIIANHY